MLEKNERAILQFSGGKDSAAMLYLARPHLERITVFFADTGAVYQHVVEFVHETCRKLGANLQVIRPPIPVQEYTAIAGLPSDIVPIEAMQEFQPFLGKKAPQLVQSYMRCCSAMLFEPMMKAVKESGVKIVLRGSKASDVRVGVGDRHIEDGIEYRSPLWHWSDADVMAYLEREGVTLPAHYSAVPDSLDCWLCTAHLKRHGAAKLKWTREAYPELWPQVKQRLTALKIVLDGERTMIADAIDVAEQA